MVTPLVRVPLIAILAVLALGLTGCAGADSISMLHPHGLVADAQRRWLIDINLVMAIVVVPVFVLVPLFAWRYRRRNGNVAYQPHWTFSWPLEFAVWGVPVLIVAALAVLIIYKQSVLDPYDRLSKTARPLEVQVVALDWKFLFIYPTLHIATASALVIPENRPVDFHLTSDATMQSFFIPSLGSQIYTMAGMVTQLHLVANTLGKVMGENTQFNGDHFQDEHFDVEVLPQAGFDQWVAKQQADGRVFDAHAFETLAVHGTIGRAKQMFGVPDQMTLSFKNVDPHFFASIVDKYNPGAMSMATSAPPADGAMRGMQ